MASRFSGTNDAFSVLLTNNPFLGQSAGLHSLVPTGSSGENKHGMVGATSFAASDSVPSSPRAFSFGKNNKPFGVEGKITFGSENPNFSSSPKSILKKGKATRHKPAWQVSAFGSEYVAAQPFSSTAASKGFPISPTPQNPFAPKNNPFESPIAQNPFATKNNPFASTGLTSPAAASPFAAAKSTVQTSCFSRRVSFSSYLSGLSHFATREEEISAPTNPFVRTDPGASSSNSGADIFASERAAKSNQNNPFTSSVQFPPALILASTKTNPFAQRDTGTPFSNVGANPFAPNRGVQSSQRRHPFTPDSISSASPFAPEVAGKLTQNDAFTPMISKTGDTAGASQTNLFFRNEEASEANPFPPLSKASETPVAEWKAVTLTDFNHSQTFEQQRTSSSSTNTVPVVSFFGPRNPSNSSIKANESTVPGPRPAFSSNPSRSAGVVGAKNCMVATASLLAEQAANPAQRPVVQPVPGTEPYVIREVGSVILPTTNEILASQLAALEIKRRELEKSSISSMLPSSSPLLLQEKALEPDVIPKVVNLPAYSYFPKHYRNSVRKSKAQIRPRGFAPKSSKKTPRSPVNTQQFSKMKLIL